MTPDRVLTDIRQSRTSWRALLFVADCTRSDTTGLFASDETTALYFHGREWSGICAANSSLEVPGIWLRRGDLRIWQRRSASEPAGKLIKVASMLQI